ncbi:MAG: hypothetical protein ABJB09_05895 [Verrucomicrobiota bacterium]
MSDPNGPKKETVRITLPPRSAAGSANGDAPKKETVRIIFPPPPPARAATFKSPSAPLTAAPIAPPPAPPLVRRPPAPASTVLPPAPKPPVAPVVTPPPTVGTSGIYPGASAPPGPKKETARIRLIPDPIAAPAPMVKMAKTQRLMTAPAVRVQTVPVNVASAPTSIEVDRFESIPKSFCWALLCVSSLILLFQLWTFFSF